MCNYIISAAILAFWLSVSSSWFIDSTIEKFDTETMGVAVWTVFLASLESEIHLGAGIFTPPSFNTNVSENNIQHMGVQKWGAQQLTQFYKTIS